MQMPVPQPDTSALTITGGCMIAILKKKELLEDIFSTRTISSGCDVEINKNTVHDTRRPRTSNNLYFPHDSPRHL